MIIHLIGSMRHFDEDLPFMQTIANTIDNHKSTVARKWVEAVEDRKARQSRIEESLDWQEIVTDSVNALRRSDALIVEGSRFNYSQGYQTALALEHNIPVLNLYRKNLKEYKEWPDKLFVSGVRSPLFTNKEYKNTKDLETIVSNFLENIQTKSIQLDLTLFLENNIYNQIERKARETGRSKSSVIKGIILDNTDIDTGKSK